MASQLEHFHTARRTQFKFSETTKYWVVITAPLVTPVLGGRDRGRPEQGG